MKKERKEKKIAQKLFLLSSNFSLVSSLSPPCFILDVREEKELCKPQAFWIMSAYYWTFFLLILFLNAVLNFLVKIGFVWKDCSLISSQSSGEGTNEVLLWGSKA